MVRHLFNVNVADFALQLIQVYLTCAKDAPSSVQSTHDHILKELSIGIVEPGSSDQGHLFVELFICLLLVFLFLDCCLFLLFLIFVFLLFFVVLRLIRLVWCDT